MTGYGAVIVVDGVRPGFVRDGDEIGWQEYADLNTWWRTGNIVWARVKAIRLKSDHPQYLVAQHHGMVMRTTDARPVDFDALRPVLLEDGTVYKRPERQHTWGPDSRIIGYHPLPAPPSAEQVPLEFQATPDWFQYADIVQQLQHNPAALAEFVALHKAPPVDEAEALWIEVWSEYHAGDSARHGTLKAVDKIRDHLAKVRAEIVKG